MNYNISRIVKIAVFFSLLLFIGHPVNADVLDENGSGADSFFGIPDLLSDLIDAFYETNSNKGAENGGVGSKEVDIFTTMENINLVKYADPKIDGDIGYYIKQHVNSSIAEEIFKDNTELQRDLYILLAESLPNSKDFTIEEFEVLIYPLVMDEDLSLPSCLSRPNGLKITLYADNIDEPTGKTLWVYERYSTDIVRSIYNKGYGDKIGMIYIKFIDMDSGEDIVHLILDAGTAEVCRQFWANPESYIGLEGWSEVKINNDYDIVFYEESQNRISLALEDSLFTEPVPESDVELSDITGISYDPLLTSCISESYNELVYRLDEIGEYCNRGEKSKVLTSSNDLGFYIYKLRSVVNRIPASGDLAEIKLEYLNALDEISTAASDYWYFATYYDSDSLSRASERSDAGVTRLNNLASGVGIAAVDIANIDKPSGSAVLDSYSMFETFHYKDSTGSNDISLRIVDWRLKNNLLTKKVASGEKGTIYSEYNTEFLVVSVVFTHMGYRGEGIEQIVSPPESSFKLQYAGINYSPITIEDYLQNSGEPYRSKKVDRREVYDSVLVFEINNDLRQAFDEKKAYILVDLGEYGIQTWSLERPGSE